MNEFWNDEYLRKSTPATNIIENDKEYKLQFAAPGMKKEDVKISLNGKVLTVTMEKSEKKEEKNEKFLRRDFGHTEFSQSYTLPEDADLKAIEAKVEDGVLNVTLPKLSPECKEDAVKYIDIQ
jgi:HSP20 family protein